jgi:hypothetical protein
MFGCMDPPPIDGLGTTDRKRVPKQEFGQQRPLATTETPKPAFCHRSDIKSQVILEEFECIRDISVTNVKDVEIHFSRIRLVAPADLCVSLKI